MKRLIVIIGLLLAIVCVKASDGAKFVLDNYLIPVKQPGAMIGRICPVPETAEIVQDTASLFRLDVKSGTLCLKKGKVVIDDPASFRYGITLALDGQLCEFELICDGYSRNGVVAHRGAWKRTGVLQNSLRSFRHAVRLGCEGSEMDVWLTVDNKVVLSHDPHVYGLSVEDSTSLSLFQETIGKDDPVTSLQEILLEARGQNTTHPVIEIKDSRKGLARTLQLTDSVVSIVHRMKMQGDVLYISFNYEVLKRIRSLDATAKVLYLWEDKQTLQQLVDDGITGIDYSYYAFRKNPLLVEDAHAKGLLTNVWTVNNADELEKYYRQGVDYITTDEPELLLKIIKSLK